jgi:hypothetical protein
LAWTQEKEMNEETSNEKNSDHFSTDRN